MKSIFKLLIFILAIQAQAQNNLISNWSFEATQGGKELKIKQAGMIDQVMGWSSPSEPKADVFSRQAKEPLFLVPTNQYGRQDLDDGNHYAGIVAYGDKEKSPKTYLSTQLTESLQKDSFYCVNFFVSLSDLSKTANNNIGAHFSTNPVLAQDLKSYKITPQVLPHGNKIVEDQYLWTEICGMFKAQGDEKYLTIGNFSSDATTQVIKVKKPKEFTQQQIGIGYYFVDDVRVYMSDSIRGCSCKDTESKESMKVIYKKTEGDNLESNPTKIVEYKMVYFDAKSTTLTEAATNNISMVAKVLTEHPDAKIIVYGSTDKEEELLMTKSKIDLSAKRCDVVQKVLIAKGISKERITVKPLKDSKSTATKDAKLLKDYRKVWFEIAP